MQDEGRRKALQAALALSGACLLGSGRAIAAPPLPAGRSGGAALQRIAFGSCVHQDRPQPIWDDVLATRPDLFLFLGGNIYGDTRELAVLEREYAKLAAQPGFQRLRAATKVMATWDDHDYGYAAPVAPAYEYAPVTYDAPVVEEDIEVDAEPVTTYRRSTTIEQVPTATYREQRTIVRKY